MSRTLSRDQSKSVLIKRNNAMKTALVLIDDLLLRNNLDVDTLSDPWTLVYRDTKLPYLQPKGSDEQS
jgi:hypothetical protein